VFNPMRRRSAHFPSVVFAVRQEIDYLTDDWTADSQPPMTLLYSRRISSLTGHSPPIQSRSGFALGFLDALSVDLSPAISAIRDVPTMPPGGFLFCAEQRR
jgi:hypothetical protein